MAVELDPLVPRHGAQAHSDVVLRAVAEGAVGEGFGGGEGPVWIGRWGGAGEGGGGPGSWRAVGGFEVGGGGFFQGWCGGLVLGEGGVAAAAAGEVGGE